MRENGTNKLVCKNNQIYAAEIIKHLLIMNQETEVDPLAEAAKEKPTPKAKASSSSNTAQSSLDTTEAASITAGRVTRKRN